MTRSARRVALAWTFALAAPAAGFWAGRPRPLPPADFSFALPKDVGTLDPAHATSQAEAWILWNLFEGLARFDPETLEPEPAAAERIEPEPGGRRWVARLRPGLRWSDGRPLGASDFAYAFQRIADPREGSPHAALFGAIERVTAPDDRTVVLDLRRPVPYLPALLAHFAAVPVRRDLVERFGDRWTEPGRLVTNGPFRLVLRRIRERVRLERNPYYRRASRVALGVVDAYAVESRATALNLYLTGALDWVNAVPPEAVPPLRGRPDLHLSPVLATNFLRFNVRRPPLDDPRVRRALDLAIDRSSLCEHVLVRGDVPAPSLVPPRLAGYVPPAVARFDPDRARDLLARAGHPGGRGVRELELLHAADTTARAVAEVIARDLGRLLGLRVRTTAQELKVFLVSQRRLDYDLCLAVWYGDYPDPSTFLDCFRSDSPNNRTGWRDPEYDELLARSEVETDAVRRFEFLRLAEERLLRLSPIAPISFRAQPNLVSPRVEGFTSNLLDYHPLDRLRLAPDR